MGLRLFPRNRIRPPHHDGARGDRRRVHECTPGSRRSTTTMKSDNEQRDAFGKNVLHVGAGFKEKERPHVLETLSTLGPHLLGRWDSRDIDVEVSLQDRGGKE